MEALNNTENAPVEFVKKDWEVMKLLIRVLKPFFEITEMLSKSDASISMSIPAVTLILKSLREEEKDKGVLGLMREIKAEIEWRFEEMESEEHYTLSTLLDSRFKGHFYRNPNTRSRAKEALLQKLMEKIREKSTPVQVRNTHLTLECQSIRMHMSIDNEL